MHDVKFEMLPMKLLLDLTERDCKWPVKEDKGAIGKFWFCSQNKPAGQPYCAKHTSMLKREK